MNVQKENRRWIKEGFILLVFLICFLSFSNKSFGKTNKVSETTYAEAFVLKDLQDALSNTTQQTVPLNRAFSFPSFFIFHDQIRSKMRDQKINTRIRGLQNKEFPPKSFDFNKNHIRYFFTADDEEPVH